MGRDWRPSQPRDRHNALLWARDVVRGNNWCVIDTETTGREFSDQVIEVSVCNPQTLETKTWRVRPTCAISEEAQAVHGISEADLINEPTYAEIWPTIEEHIVGITPGRYTVFYNAGFDYARLWASARGQNPKMAEPRIWKEQCAMIRYAAIHEVGPGKYGVPGYSGYRWQKLDVACKALGIPIEGTLHSSATDARLTTLLMLKMAEIAEREVPADLIATHDKGRASMQEFLRRKQGMRGA